MKKGIVIGMLCMALLSLAGCGTYKMISRPAPHYLPDSSLPRLASAKPLAIKNSSTGKAGALDDLCGFTSVRVTGSLYDFTESAVAIAGDAFKRKNIPLDPNADRLLEMSISEATCSKGWQFSAGLKLSVKTGSGLIKDYSSAETYAFGYSTTNTFEVIMARLVEQMVNDADVLQYLR